MGQMLDKLDAHLRSGGYEGDPIRMFLAGGMALHYHCGARYTEDVDASEPGTPFPCLSCLC